jgi:ABC-type Fe3+-hydroxamate transport system substrate-binding protein
MVCLCPSITETLLHLVPAGHVVGRTRFCIHPAHTVATIPTLGGTKDPKIDRIVSLQPDLIIAEKEENRKEDIEALGQVAPVYVFDIRTVQQGLALPARLGALVGQEAAGQELHRKAQTIADDLYNQLAAHNRPRIGYFIWRNPWMVAGADTYIDSLLTWLGYHNVFAEPEWSSSRYPTLTSEDIRRAAPQTVWLSSEPYPFAAKHLAECGALLPSSAIRLVDGEPFSWYGYGLIRGAETLRALAAPRH